MIPYFEDYSIRLYLEDCLGVLPSLPNASVDAVICDPPYGLANHHPTVVAETLAAWLAGDRTRMPSGGGFMGRSWDSFVPPPAVWDECLRVFKPGGHLIAFAGARTVDLMALSIRLAGFEVRDGLSWIYGSGMPKGQDVAKSIDRRRDDHAQVLKVTAWLADARDAAGWTNKRMDALFGFNGMAGHWTSRGKAASVPTLAQWYSLREAMRFNDAEILALVEELNSRVGSLGEAWGQRKVIGQGHRVRRESDVPIAPLSAGAYAVTAPASEAAHRWQGWNTQMKPAHEPIVLARKSTGFNTTVANVLQHGTGALHIDACRTLAGPDYAEKCASVAGLSSNRTGDAYGEWPGVRGDSTHPAGRWPTNVVLSHSALIDSDGAVLGDACADGCMPDCPVAELDRQSGANRVGKPRETGASRFFPTFRYEPKAPTSERPRLAGGTAWPTVKPLALMRWLVRLVTPPSGLVLDPFAGTGTTLEACVAEGMRGVGTERDKTAADLAVVRLSKPIALSLFADDGLEREEP